MPGKTLKPLSLEDCRGLEAHLNAMIATDTRPLAQQNRYSARTGAKRTQILRVEVIPLGAARDVVQPDPVANAGVTTDATGRFTSGPIHESDIDQGVRADCVLLASVLSWTFRDPLFSNDLLYLTGPSTVVEQYYFNGAILLVHTSLIVATGFNQFDVPANQQDVRIEIMEKTWGFARSGVNDYLKDDYAGGGDVFTAWGLDAVLGFLSELQEALAEGKLAVCISFAATGVDSAGHDYTSNHCYAVKSYDGVNLVMQNPWWGGTDIVVIAKFFLSAGWWGGPYIATIPTPKLLLAPHPTTIPPTPATPTPIPTDPAAAIARLTADIAALNAAINNLLTVEAK